MTTNLKNIIIQDVFLKNFDGKNNWMFDFRRVSLTPKFLEIYVSLFFEKYKDNNIQICGLESASIALLSAIVLESNKRNIPINGFFIRKSRKKHNLCQALEGVPNKKPVVIIDDIINSGKSIVSQIEVLKTMNLEVSSIFTLVRFRDLYFYNFLKSPIVIDSIFELNDFKKELSVENLKDNNLGIKPIPYRVAWKFKSEGANLSLVVPKSAPLLYKNRLYFGTDSGNFFCLNTLNGEAIWSYKVPFGSQGKFILSSPIIYNDTVFFGAYDGNVYALNAKDGTKKWIYYDADWIGSSPSINTKQGLLYIGLEYGVFSKKGGLAALNAKTGEEVWKDYHDGLTHCSPYYSEKNNLVTIVSNDGMLHIYNAKNGKKLKALKINTESKASFAESDDGRFIAFGGFNGSLYTLDTRTLEVLERSSADFGIYSTPAWYKNYIVFCSLDKNIYCFDMEKKEIKWIFKTFGRIFSTPLIVNGLIYVGSNNGRLYVVDIQTGEEKGYLPFSERIVNKIIIDKKENVLYIPTVINELYKVSIQNN